MSDRFEAETKATKSFMNLIEGAKESKRLYEQAGMSLPEPLLRFLGEDPKNYRTYPSKGRQTIIIPAPASPERPLGAGEDWIYVPLSAIGIQALVLGVLSQADQPLRFKDVTKKVNEYRPEVLVGTISNIGTRLKGDVIDLSEDGWVLRNKKQAPRIEDGFAWGKMEIFSRQDVAAYRREGLLHLLGMYQSGLQTVQIVKLLASCPWMLAQVNKDQIKADLAELLGEGRIRQIGNTRKYSLRAK